MTRAKPTFYYNLRCNGDNYRITKFDSDFSVESSYLTTTTECDCPAGVRPTCRHRQMLPSMIAMGLLDKPLFYDYDRQSVENGPDLGDMGEELEETQAMPHGALADAMPHEANTMAHEALIEGPQITATEIDERMTKLDGPQAPVFEEAIDLLHKLATGLPSGVTVVDLSDPHGAYNAVAEALGEPTLPKPADAPFRRRF